MGTRSTRVLVVDDFEEWRRFYCSTLQKKSEFQVIGEVSDGLEAVRQAQQLQPDLILLDIGLPSMNGIEAARRIREISSTSKILFVTENRSRDIAEEALRSGANGYVVKLDAANELLPAVDAVLQGKRFVSSSMAGHDLTDSTDEREADNPHRNGVVRPFPLKSVEIVGQHVAGFYFDDRRLLDDLTQFIGAALNAGNAAIVAATEPHRGSLLPRLQAYGLDIGAAIEQGRYVALDAADALLTFMVNGMPDPVPFMKVFGNLILTAANAAKAEHPRVAIFGECVHLLWAEGNVEAAIKMEKLGNQLVKQYDIDILCGYSLTGVQQRMDEHVFQRICAEHSAVCSQ